MTPLIEMRSRRRRPDLDMAPLIDVVFLLLIFFMLVSNYSSSTSLDLSLPVGGDVHTADARTPLRISVDGDGVIRVDSEVIGMNDLASTVTAQLADDPDRPVQLAMDRMLEVQLMVRILDELKATGVTDLDIATDDLP